MKKIILAIVIMACFVSQINAQINFGIKGGLNFDNFKVGDVKNAKEKLTVKNSSGWQAGALLQIKIPVIGIGLQPEILYTVKKAEINTKENSISYFEVPINFQWGPDLLILHPFVMFGPYFGYAVNFKGDTFTKENVEKLDWGFGVGGGLDIWKFQLGARYSFGLKNVGVENLEELKNRTLSLSLAYKF